MNSSQIDPVTCGARGAVAERMTLIALHQENTKTVWEGPRERLARFGASALGETELLAVLLGTGTADEPVMTLAESVLREAGGLRGLARQGLAALATHPGIGVTKAARVAAAIELGRRTIEEPIPHAGRIQSSRDVDRAFRPRLTHAEVEYFVALALDARNRVLAELVIAKGSTSSCPVAPADVFRALLREAAVATVLVHNHPSGDPTPSAADLELTDRLVAAGTLVGVRIHDHVIVAREGYSSLLDQGLIRRC